MPKAACQVCKENMPLHILALHIEGCMESAGDDDDDEVNSYNKEDMAKQYIYLGITV